MKIDPEELAKSTDIDFTELHENWNTYTLSDGTTLKVKLVLKGVKRLEMHEADGKPVYMIQSQNFVRSLDVPKELYREPKKSDISPV